MRGVGRAGTTPGAEPLDVVRRAFDASSKGLTSGAGNGMYRQFEANGEGEWTLQADAEISTYFDREKYHIELKYQPEYRELCCRRITYDGKAVRDASFAPGWRTQGLTRVLTADDYGDGLRRPNMADFPWDVAKLASNVFNIERLVKNVTVSQIEIRETPEGDLVGATPVINSKGARVRYEWPKKFAYNIARLQVLRDDEPRPVNGYRVEWKLSANGLWYIRSLQEDFVMLPERRRFRRVMKYTVFEPNARIDPEVFTYDWLRRPMEVDATINGPGAR